MLHIINKSHFEKNSLRSCIGVIDSKDVILLIEDGVISATNNNLQAIAKLALNGKIYALEADLEARGILEKIVNNIKLVDYHGFVDLVIKHKTSICWI